MRTVPAKILRQISYLSSGVNVLRYALGQAVTQAQRDRRQRSPMPLSRTVT